MPERVDILLGFDYGTRRIGVAVGNAITGNAQPVATVSNGEDTDWPALSRLVSEWRPDALVVGLPLGNDGQEQAITTRARTFMRQLGDYFALPVHLMDERFSTIEAAERLRSARASGSHGKRLVKGETDAMAAQVILEGWLSERDGKAPA